MREVEELLSARAWGINWGHTLSYASRLDAGSTNPAADNPNGYRWFVAQMPELGQDAGGNIQVIMIINDAVWFMKSGTNYVARFFTLDTLSENAASKEITYTDSAGQAWTFYSFDSSVASQLRGRFKSFTDPFGATYNAAYNGSNQIVTMAFGGSPAVSFNYEYYTGSGGKLQYATLKRGTTSVRRLFFTYYSSGDLNGSAGDLRSQTLKQWNGSTWEEITTHYYRYYRSGDTDGFEHGLQYVLRGEAYRQAVAWGNAQVPALSIDQLTISDINRFADNRFIYNSDGRVSEEHVAGPNRTSSSLTSARYQYSFVASTYVAVAQSDRFNKWVRTTTETLPDGVTTQKVITNYAGQIILKDYVEAGTGGRQWLSYYIYDSEGRVVEEIFTEAIDSYATSTNGDIVVSVKSNIGLIKTRSYYSTTNNVTGAVAGLLQTEGVKRGGAGSVTKVRDLNYENYSQSGRRFCPPRGERLFQSDATGGSDGASTSYEYILFSGALRIEQRTTILPVVDANKNGSGANVYKTERFDQYGQTIWVREERGFLTRFKYDNASGGLIQRIDDVATGQIADSPSVPSGWSTPSGGGLHLASDYTVDSLGRTTQELKPVHSVPLNGVDTSLRTAFWTVYRDAAGETRSAAGYMTQSSSSSNTALIEPITVRRHDDSGRVVESIVTRRAAGVSGVLTSTENVSDQTRWVNLKRWTYYNNELSANLEKAYFVIPTSGDGTSTDNYSETIFQYDQEGHLLRQRSPNSTIRRWTYDIRGRVTSLWIGTDDTGATPLDPSAGGANNMCAVEILEYDAGGVGSDKLTRITRPVDGNSANDRVENRSFDWRNRLTQISRNHGYREDWSLDNLGRRFRVDYKEDSTGVLVARRDFLFDPLGRVYKAINFSVSGGTATSGPSSEKWYDGSGNVIKSTVPTSRTLTKYRFDGLGRKIRVYTTVNAADDTYAEAGSVATDIVLEQKEISYDAAGNVVYILGRQRFHNASGTGELANPTIEPRARLDHTAFYNDPVARPIAKAYYGSYGGNSFSRSSTIPSRSDTILVNTTEYTWSQLNSGEAFLRAETIVDKDPKNIEQRKKRDSARRLVSVVDDFGGVAQTKSIKYTLDGRVAEILVVNSTTGNQSTKFLYGTTLGDSSIACNDYLRSVIFPDSTDTTTSGTDQVKFEYNRQGDSTKRTDQAGTVHQYDYDKLGRVVHDRITSLGSNINGAVRRISYEYETRGILQLITSWDNAAVGSGTIVNQVKFAFDGLGLMTSEWQSQTGAVDPSTTPKIVYGYGTGGLTYSRLESITYPTPGTRVLTYEYGASGGVDDLLSRVSLIKDGSTVLAEYSYLGLKEFVRVSYSSQPGVELTYSKQGAESNGDAGDQYTGIDRFGRVVDQRWLKSSDGSSRVRIQYGFDRNGNRLFRDDLVASTGQDELYAYDTLNQINQRQRGVLNSSRTAIVGTADAQENFSYDASGNWNGASSGYIARSNGVVILDQNRTNNRVNEIQTISASTGLNWSDPAYDAAGNMVSIPRPTLLSNGYVGVYDAWNRLVELLDGAMSVAVYRYDGFSRRTTKSVGGVTRRFYYSISWQVLEERLGSSTTSDRQFVWGMRYVDDLIARNFGSVRLYVLHDYFSPVAVVDSTGAVQERYGYEAFGSCRVMDASFSSRTNSLYEWETLFGAYRWDSESGLLQVRFRYYHPNLGVWIGPDPALYVDGINLYRYAGNSPTNFVDVLGLNALTFPVILLELLLLSLLLSMLYPLLRELIRQLLNSFSQSGSAAVRCRLVDRKAQTIAGNNDAVLCVYDCSAAGINIPMFVSVGDGNCPTDPCPDELSDWPI